MEMRVASPAADTIKSMMISVDDLFGDGQVVVET
jgi:hypothetical protein